MARYFRRKKFCRITAEKTKEIDDIKASLEEIQRVLGINKDEASK